MLCYWVQKSWELQIYRMHPWPELQVYDSEQGAAQWVAQDHLGSVLQGDKAFRQHIVDQPLHKPEVAHLV